ncbi:response regulator transcription factor [Aeromonas caviae]|uniref:response regulator transcription factor n=1 Tax=Aeromonas caviae TaxID=648 RepID=UPI002B4A9B39|nr:response regulator transcription factor [Aeromonas caviae]
MPRIMIVDDHPVVRLAVRVLLEPQGYEIVGEADNGIEALRLAREQLPDVVILDIGIPRLDGLQVITRLRTMGSSVRVLVLTSLGTESIASRCMQAGASGFISKDEDLSDLAGAVKAVLSGYSFFPYEMFGASPDGRGQQSEQRMLASLSNRELMVLQQLAQGLTNKQIADAMMLSNKTISTYKTRLLQKLNAKSLVALLEFAKRNAVI